jgi:hypothetical protein
MTTKVPKRYKVLGCKFNGTPATWAKEYKKRFIGVGNYPPEGLLYVYREDDLRSCLGMMALCHLGYDVPVEPEVFLNRGFDVAVDYFCGDWWKANKDSVRAMDKSAKRRDLSWFRAFSPGLLLGLLTEQWADLARVCAWVDADLRPEFLGEDFEEETAYVYQSVAASLRPEPMPGLEKLEAKISKSKAIGPKLLFQAWDAARRGDQPAFAAALTRSLEHFAANDGSGPIAEDWIATDQSVVVLAARRLGLRLPAVPSWLEALLITRDSLGLPSASG